jgi:hypothetical protein
MSNETGGLRVWRSAQAVPILPLSNGPLPERSPQLAVGRLIQQNATRNPRRLRKPPERSVFRD